MITVYLGVRAGSEKYLGSKCLLILNTLIFDNRLPRSVSQGFLIPTRAVVCLTSALEMFLENMKWAEHLHRPGFAFNYESVDFYYFFLNFLSIYASLCGAEALCCYAKRQKAK